VIVSGLSSSDAIPNVESARETNSFLQTRVVPFIRLDYAPQFSQLTFLHLGL
jgi:hypothetical protein